MTISLLKSLSLSIVIAAAALVAPAAASAACAGAPSEGKREFNAELLLQADGAITGKVLRRRVVELPGKAVQTVTVYRIGRSFKKKRRLTPGTRLQVWSGVSEGIYQRVGSRGGIFLDRSKKRWNGSGCSQVDRVDLRRAARDTNKI